VPRSMQGLGPDGCTVLMALENSDSETASLLDWINHTPRDVLACDLGVDASALRSIPDHAPLLFAAAIPGALSDDQSRQHQASVPAPFHFPLMSVRPIEAKGGRIRIADMNNFRASTKLCATLVELEPGGMRELHFHPNADELTMILSGSGRMTVLAGKAGANTVDLSQNSVAYIPRLWGHTIQNTGSVPMRFLEVMDSGEYRDISLKNWLANMPPALMNAHTGIDPAFFRNLGKDKTPIMPV
jgi:oxalate decarboxylase